MYSLFKKPVFYKWLGSSLKVSSSYFAQIITLLLIRTHIVICQYLNEIRKQWLFEFRFSNFKNENRNLWIF